jgi:hypothetical protein
MDAHLGMITPEQTGESGARGTLHQRSGCPPPSDGHGVSSAVVAPDRFALPASGADETLLLIDIVNAEGVIILQTVWATTPDRHYGHRLTRFETIIGGHAPLMDRLAILTPALWRVPTRLRRPAGCR